MRRFSSRPLLSLFLTVLLAGAGVTCQPASAQQPTVGPNASATSFDDAVRTAASDSALVDLAGTLLEARAETDISYAAYQRAVWSFRNHHPTFYGTFFGDPLYASYDARYERLVWKRRVIETEINPRTSIQSAIPFLCDPLSYDPAFEGMCRGFEFAASEFFRLPPFITPSQLKARPEIASAAERRRSSTRPLDRRSPRPFDRSREQDDSPSEPDTLTRRPDRNNPSADERDPVSPQVPEEVVSQMQQTAENLRRVEVRERVRETVEEAYGERESVTSEERAELIDRLAEAAPTSGGHDDVSSYVRDQVERIERIRDRAEERADRTRSRADRTSFSHRPEGARKPDADPSPSRRAGADGSSENTPSMPDRDDVKRNGADESGAQ